MTSNGPWPEPTPWYRLIGVLNLLVFAFAIPPVFIAAIHHVYGLPTWTVGVGLTFLFAAFALAVYTTVRALESGAHY